MPGPAVVPVEARARVWWDDNAGSWVYCRPGGRLPVQADSWAAAVSAVLTPPSPSPAPVACSLRERWHRWWTETPARNQGDY